MAMSTILCVCFFAEHNLPFSTAEHMIDLMKVMFPDSQIAQSMFMKRSKCTELVKVIGKCAFDYTLENLKNNPFSVIIDETTDISTQNPCAVLVKYFYSEASGIKTSVINLMDLYTGDNDNEGASGQNCIHRL